MNRFFVAHLFVIIIYILLTDMLHIKDHNIRKTNDLTQFNENNSTIDIHGIALRVSER